MPSFAMIRCKIFIFVSPKILLCPMQSKGGGTIRAGHAAVLLVFEPVVPKGELALLVLAVSEKFSAGKFCKSTR
jgi:hypothetical protein